MEGIRKGKKKGADDSSAPFGVKLMVYNLFSIAVICVGHGHQSVNNMRHL